MPGIDPQIVEHEIKMYDGAKPRSEKSSWPVNPKKVVSIKAEVENFFMHSLSIWFP
jgi:hypothetical protein